MACCQSRDDSSESYKNDGNRDNSSLAGECEGTLMALQSLADCFSACELVELGEGWGRGIAVAQSTTMMFVVIYYLSPAMFIKAFPCSTWFGPAIVISLQAYKCSCNINIHDLAKLFRTRSRDARARSPTPGTARSGIRAASSRAYGCTV